MENACPAMVGSESGRVGGRQDRPTQVAVPGSAAFAQPCNCSPLWHSALQLGRQNGEAGTGADPGSRTDTYVLAEV